MALSETDTSDCNSDSSVDGTKQERKEKFFTKIVVRRLPPSMNKESFLTQVSPLPDYDYMYFVRADMSLGEYAFSRAYINFKNSTDIFIFKEKFDNYVFLDSKGSEYAAVVEFAPFSRIPKKRNKTRNDPKCGTIESDPIYIDFVESLNEVPNETEEKPEYCFQPSVDDDKKITNTPLLDFIKQRRIDRQKIKEEKREERKRRELERKRIKEEERRGRKKIEHVSHSTNVTKIATSKTTNTSFDVIDENKSESNPKPKDKKVDDYRNRSGKPGVKEYGEKRSYSSSKDVHRTLDKKSPTKIRQRNQNVIEREPRRTEYKGKRDDAAIRHKKDEDKTEKKVKKYSERREERKNEFKKQESRSESSTTNVTEIEKNINESKSEDNKSDSKSTEDLHREKEDSKSRNDSENSNEKENTRSEKDPRTQRRIRNKDRPTMAIYQPGMGLNRNRNKTNGGSADEGQKSNDSNNSEANTTEQ